MSARKRGVKLQEVIVACGLVLALWLAGALPARADGVVRGFYFYSPDCEHCQAVANEVLPALRERFGSRLELRMFDINNTRNYQVLLDLEKRYKVEEGLPEVFIGPDALVGEEAVRAELAGLIEKHLAAGGTGFPTQDMPVAVEQPTAAPAPSNAPLVHVAYFFKRGCNACDRAAYDLEFLRNRFPNLRITSFDIAEQSALNEALAIRLGLPEANRLVTPAIFVGNGALVGPDVTLANLQTLFERYEQAGAGPVWEGVDVEAGSKSILDRFRSFGPLTVAVAGLIDGLNPCAFATLIFFISYLAFLGRSRREIILTGAAFTVGVFATYLLVGLGLLRFVQALPKIQTAGNIVGRIVYGLMAAACLVFAGLSIYDAWQARRNKPEAMQLRLPRFLQKRVHRVIRENSSRSAFMGVATLTGLVVSFLELACTGQVYLPTILFVLSVPQLRLDAVSYLVLYNLIFIVPLIVVFLLAAFGIGSDRLAGLVQKHTGTVKLLTAGVFALLGVWLFTVVV